MNTKPNQTEPIEQPALSAVEGLIHDVNSQCGSLKSAAGLLKNASPKEAHELLELMIKQAQVLHQKIASYEELLGRQ